MAIQVETATPISTGAVKEQPQTKTPVTSQQHVERQAAWTTTSVPTAAEGYGLQELPARAPKATSTAWSAAAERIQQNEYGRAVDLGPVSTGGELGLLSVKSTSALSSPVALRSTDAQAALSSTGLDNARPSTAMARLTQPRLGPPLKGMAYKSYLQELPPRATCTSSPHEPRRGATKPAVSAATTPDRWRGRSWPDKATLAAKAEVATPEPSDRGSTLEPEALALLQALPAPNRGQLPPRKWGQPESRDEVYRLLAAAAKAAAAAEYELALRGYLRAFEVTRAPPLLLSVASMHLRLGQGHARPATAKARLLTLTLTQALALTPTLTLTSHRQDPLDLRQLATVFAMCPGAPDGWSTASTVGRRHARA